MTVVEQVANLSPVVH